MLKSHPNFYCKRKTVYRFGKFKMPKKEGVFNKNEILTIPRAGYPIEKGLSRSMEIRLRLIYIITILMIK